MGLVPHIGITSGRDWAMDVEAKQIRSRSYHMRHRTRINLGAQGTPSPYNLTPSSSFHLIVDLLSPSSSVALPKLDCGT